MRKVGGWIVFAFGILYSFIAPTVVRAIATSTGNMVFGGMTLQLIIGFGLIYGGWRLAHPKKKEE